MLDKMIGFIGAGNMGSAMIGGILDASLVTTSQIIASAHSPETLDKNPDKIFHRDNPVKRGRCRTKRYFVSRCKTK